MVDLIRGLEVLERVGGLTDLLLPFVLIFTIIFAILQKTDILGKGKKNLNVALALVISLMVVIPHILQYYPDPQYDPVVIINSAIPNVSIIIVAVVMILLLIGLLGGEAKWIGGSLSGWIAILSILIILYIFGRAAGWFNYLPQWAWWLDDPDTQALVIIILVFGIIIWFITKEPTQEKNQLSFLKNLGDFFKKGE